MTAKKLPDSLIRRQFSPEFKAKLVSASKRPGASLAAIALANGINSNQLRRWCKEHVSGYAWSNPAEGHSNRHYSDEYKRMIVAQCQQPGATATSVARSNALHPNLVGTWVKKLHPAHRPCATAQELEGQAVALLPIMVSEEVQLPARPAAGLGHIDIELGAAHIRLHGTPDPKTLRVVLEVLR